MLNALSGELDVGERDHGFAHECCGFLCARLVPGQMRPTSLGLFAAFLLTLGRASVGSEPTDAMYAERLLAALSTETQAAETNNALGEPVRRAKLALERSVQLRALGDGPRATLAEAEARAWAEAASEVVKVSRREAEAAEARTKVLKLVEAEKRARADYEMLSRQVSRTRVEVTRVESEPVPPLEKPRARRKRRQGGH